jgi:DNA-binding transcriptional LysR family regulator
MTVNETPTSDIRMGRRVTLRDLQVLLAVAQFGSMAKAASHLSITQPAVSQAVANLERAFGARLIDRGPLGAVLTHYGEAIQKRGMEVFDALKQGSRDIAYLSDAGTGDVWIGANEVLLGGFVPAVVQRLADQRSNIVVHALTVNTSDFDFEKLRERKLDLLLGRVMPLTDDDLNVETLYEEGLSVIVSQDSPWARKRKVTLADLADGPWIFGEQDNIVRSLVSAVFRTKGLDAPRVSVVSVSMHLRLALLATGKYFSTIPNSFVRDGVERWSLKILPIDLGLRLPVGIFTLQNRTLSPVALNFIKNVRSVAKSVAKEW